MGNLLRGGISLYWNEFEALVWVAHPSSETIPVNWVVAGENFSWNGTNLTGKVELFPSEVGQFLGIALSPFENFIN